LNEPSFHLKTGGSKNGGSVGKKYIPKSWFQTTKGQSKQAAKMARPVKGVVTITHYMHLTFASTPPSWELFGTI